MNNSPSNSDHQVQRNLLDKSEINKIITGSLSQIRLNKIISLNILLLIVSCSGLFMLNLILNALSVDSYLQLSPTTRTVLAGVLIGAIIILANLIGLFSQRFKAINQKNLIEHFNRRFLTLEESARLLVADVKSLSSLQKLQQAKITQRFLHLYQSGIISQSLPSIQWKKLVVTLMLALLLTSALHLILANSSFLSDKQNSSVNSPQHQLQKNLKQAPQLISATVMITPPSYTQQPAAESNNLNLQILQGSLVDWQLEFNQPAIRLETAAALATPGNYYFIDGTNQRHQLTKNSQGFYQLTQKVNQTGIYRVIYTIDNEDIALPGVYSISVTRDLAPKIKIIQPNRWLVEIGKDAEPVIDLKASVSDDYAITQVEIVATVAKGSGEAVKFRDQRYQFDDFQSIANGKQYTKHWSLVDLQMEPGDEVYFSVRASDNKQPVAQQSKSATVIVRWLDEQQDELAAEGLQINFKAEYFRSQRQIIIETEQLIADQNDLARGDFEAISVDLGFSQRDLKEKFGEYLGDEAGEGEGETAAEVDQHAATLKQPSDHDEHQPEHIEAPEVGHLHEDLVDPTDHSGASELIARFAHNHGAVEVGPLSSRDPKSWMKKAVNQMWQAELYLMLSQPDEALPFEYQAYQYLKLAREADRIYVKRLGFEPPPVNEDNRLSGELKDILSYSMSVSVQRDASSDQNLFSQAHRLLSETAAKQPLQDPQIGLLNRLRARLLEMSDSRPALISYATSVEQILIAGQLSLQDCDDCISDLQHKLWQLMAMPLSIPRVNHRQFDFLPPASSDYLSRVKQLKNNVNPSANSETKP